MTTELHERGLAAADDSFRIARKAFRGIGLT